MSPKVYALVRFGGVLAPKVIEYHIGVTCVSHEDHMYIIFLAYTRLMPSSGLYSRFQGCQFFLLIFPTKVLHIVTERVSHE